MQTKKYKNLWLSFVCTILITIICGYYYYEVQNNFMPNGELLGNVSNYFHVINNLGEYKPYNFIFDICSFISTYFCGYTYKAVWLCNTLLHCLITFLTMNIALKINRKYTYYLVPLFLFMWGIPNIGESSQYGLVSDVIYQYPFDNHTTPTIGALICCNILLAYQSTTRKMIKRIYLVLLGILIVYFLLCSDALFILAFILPFLVYLFLVYKDKILAYRYLGVILITVVVCLFWVKCLATHLPSLQFLLSNNQTQYDGVVYGLSNINNISDIKQSIDNYIVGIIGYFNCQIFGKSIININNVFYLIRIVLLITTTLFSLIKLFSKSESNIEKIYPIAIIFMFFGFILSRDSATTIINIRYLTPTIPFYTIIICHMADRFVEKLLQYRPKIHLELSVVFVLLSISSVEDVWSGDMYQNMTYYETELQRIADIIQENNLGNGIAPGWAANNISACTEGKNLIEIGEFDGQELHVNFVVNSYPYPITELNYVIFGKHENYTYGNSFDYNALVKLFGEPDQVFSTEEFSLYYYDNGLLPKDYTLWENSNGGILFLGDYLQDNDAIILYSNSLQYGPYISANPGQYEVTIEGQQLSDAIVSVTTDIGTVGVPYDMQVNSNSKIVYSFSLEDKVDKMEFLLKNNTEHDMIIYKISVVKKGKN